MTSAKRRILVTGGCGFIGSNLVRELAKDASNSITVLDNLESGSLSTIEDLVKIERVKFVKGDVEDLKSIRNACEDIHSIVHLAALIDASDSVANPLPYMNTNFIGTTNVLKVAVESKVDNFVFASTAAVYGDSHQAPIKEVELPLLKPVTPYGWSKVYAEERINQVAIDSGLNATILRLFNVYGLKSSSAYAGVITRFIDCLRYGQDLVVLGDGQQSRDFVSVHDVVDAFSLAVSKKLKGTFNIGTGHAMTINDLATMVLDLAEGQRRKLKIVHESARVGDIKDSYADITRARSELGYSPKRMFKDGLREVYDSQILTATVPRMKGN